MALQFSQLSEKHLPTQCYLASIKQFIPVHLSFDPARSNRLLLVFVTHGWFHQVFPSIVRVGEARGSPKLIPFALRYPKVRP